MRKFLFIVFIWLISISNVNAYHNDAYLCSPDGYMLLSLNADGDNYFKDTTYNERYYKSNITSTTPTRGCIKENQLITLENDSSSEKGKTAIIIASTGNWNNKIEALNIFNCSTTVGGVCSSSDSSSVRYKKIGDAVFNAINNSANIGNPLPFQCSNGTCNISGESVDAAVVNALIKGYRTFTGDDYLLSTKFVLVESGAPRISGSNVVFTVSLRGFGITSSNLTFSDVQRISFYRNGVLLNNVTEIESNNYERTYQISVPNVHIVNNAICDVTNIEARIQEQKPSSNYEIVYIETEGGRLYRQIDGNIPKSIVNTTVTYSHAYNPRDCSMSPSTSRLCFNNGEESFYRKYQTGQLNRGEFIIRCCNSSDAYSRMGPIQYNNVCQPRCFTGSRPLYNQIGSGITVNEFSSRCCSDSLARSTLGASYNYYCGTSSSTTPTSTSACFTGSNSYKYQYESSRIDADRYSTLCCTDPNARTMMGPFYNNHCVSRPATSEVTQHMSCSVDSSFGYIYEAGKAGIDSENVNSVTNGTGRGGISFNITDNKYCKVNCKEDAEMYYQGFGYNPLTEQALKSGQYFQFKPYVSGSLTINNLPRIKQTRTCIYEPDVEKFTNDLYGRRLSYNNISSITTSNARNGGWYKISYEALIEYYEAGKELMKQRAKLTELKAELATVEDIICPVANVDDSIETKYITSSEFIEKYGSIVAQNSSKIYNTMDTNEAKDILDRFNNAVVYSYGVSNKDWDSTCCCNTDRGTKSTNNFSFSVPTGCVSKQTQYTTIECDSSTGKGYLYGNYCKNTQVAKRSLTVYDKTVGNSSQYSDWSCKESNVDTDNNTCKHLNLNSSTYVPDGEYSVKFYKKVSLTSCKLSTCKRTCNCTPGPGDSGGGGGGCRVCEQCEDDKRTRIDSLTTQITEVETIITTLEGEQRTAKTTYELYVRYINDAINLIVRCERPESEYNNYEPKIDYFTYDEKRNAPLAERALFNSITLEVKDTVKEEVSKGFCDSSLNCSTTSNKAERTIPKLSTTLSTNFSIPQSTYVGNHSENTGTMIFYDRGKDSTSVQVDYGLGIELYSLKPTGINIARSDTRYNENTVNYLGFGIPISIDTRSNKYNYSFEVTSLGKENRLMDSYRAVNDGATYNCNYFVSNVIVCPKDGCATCTPEYCPPDGDGSSITDYKMSEPNLMPYARLVDNGDLNPTNRELGINLSDPKGQAAIAKINADSDELYGKTPMYTVILTPTIIDEIKKLNINSSYYDFNLRCNGNGNSCISDFVSKYASQENLTTQRDRWLVYDEKLGFIYTDKRPRD